MGDLEEDRERSGSANSGRRRGMRRRQRSQEEEGTNVRWRQHRGNIKKIDRTQKGVETE